MIKKIQLKNVQGHENLVIEFRDGINCIHGKTDSGKSTIVRFLRWILFNDFNSDELRRFGSKETWGAVHLANGYIVKRIKSNSINRYTVQKPGEKEVEYNAIGKGIPDEIKKIFGVDFFEIDGIKINLNVDEQFASPFLLAKEYASTFRAKLFNYLTGNDLQDRLFKELNKDLLSFSRDISATEKMTEDLTKESQVLEAKQITLDNLHDKSSNLIAYIEDLHASYEMYYVNYQALVENHLSLVDSNNAKNRIVVIPSDAINSIKEKISLLAALESPRKRLSETRSAQEQAEQALAGIKLLSPDFVELRPKIEALASLSNVFSKLTALDSQLSEAQNNLIKIKTLPLQSERIYGILDMLGKLTQLKVDLEYNKDKQDELIESLESLKTSLEKGKTDLEAIKAQGTLCVVCDRFLSNEEIERLKK